MGTILAIYQVTKTMLDGAPLLIKAKTPRRISAIGRTTLLLAAISAGITAYLVMAVIWVMLTRLIVAPFNKLTNHVVDVGRTGDLSQRVALERNDEIGVLPRNSMPQPSSWVTCAAAWSRNPIRAAWPRLRPASSTTSAMPCLRWS